MGEPIRIQLSRALASEVLELRAALARITRTIIVSECQQIARDALNGSAGEDRAAADMKGG